MTKNWKFFKHVSVSYDTVPNKGPPVLNAATGDRWTRFHRSATVNNKTKTSRSRLASCLMNNQLYRSFLSIINVWKISYFRQYIISVLATVYLSYPERTSDCHFQSRTQRIGTITISTPSFLDVPLSFRIVTFTTFRWFVQIQDQTLLHASWTVF